VSWTVLRATLHQRRVSLFWYVLGLTVYGAFITWYFPEIMESAVFTDYIDQVFSEELMAVFGGAGLELTTLGGFIGIEYLSLIWVIIVAAAIVTFAAKAIASDVDALTMELTMSQPVSRVSVVVSRWLAMLVYAAVLNIATALPIYLATLAFDIEAEPEAFAWLFLVGTLVTMAIGSFAYMVSAFSTGGGRVAAVTAAVIGAMYAGDVVASLNETAEALHAFNLFHYWAPAEIIDEVTVSPEVWWVFGGAILATSLIAVARFMRRDLV
jgi:ABC-2 type transport system permease protein